MSVFDIFFANKTTINEKVLKQNSIQILNHSDLTLEKKNILTVTISGKFYKGYYKKSIVLIKVMRNNDFR